MKKVGLATLLALLVGFVPFSVSGAQGGPSQVYVVHGIDTGDGIGGFPVTVCVDDAVLLPDLVTGDIEGPVELAEATYAVEVFVGADQPCTGAPAIAEDFDVPADANLSIIAYWEVDVGPALTALPNDVACLEDGSARVTARHMADAGPVDVLADGAPLFEDLVNGDQDSADVPAGTYDLAVDLAAGGSVIPTTPVDLVAAVNTIIYVIGASEATPSVLVQALDVEVCPAPTTTTTTAAPAPTVAPSVTPAAPATAVRAQPAVTG